MQKPDQTRSVGHGAHDVSVDRDGLATSFVAPSTHLFNKWKKKPSSGPFSLNDEVKNTQSQFSLRADDEYWFSKVAFISGGNSTAENLIDLMTTNKAPPTKVTNERPAQSQALPEARMAKLSLLADIPATTATPNVVSEQAGFRPTMPKEEPLPMKGNRFFRMNLQGAKTPKHSLKMTPEELHSATKSDNLFFVDSHGSRRLAHAAQPKPTMERSQSPTWSNSSDEVITFAGRKSFNRKKESLDAFGRSFASRPNPHIFSDPIESTSIGGKSGRNHSVTLGERSTGPSEDEPIRSFKRMEQFTSTTAESKLASTKAMQKTKRPSAGMKSRLLDDYIANMAHEDMEGAARNAALFAQQLDTMETSGWDDEQDESEEKRQAESITSFSDAWDAADLQDFDELSTSDDIPAEIQQVLSKRCRTSGIQYLVVYEGCSVGEARWIQWDSLDSAQLQEKIEVFEEAQSKTKRHRFAENGSTKSDEEGQTAEDVEKELDDHLDEQDLLDHNIEQMSHEHITRLLSKQEHLGVNSNELVLFDMSPSPSKERVTEKSRKDSATDLPPASFLAGVREQDSYNGFDVMDTERPRLKKRSKGRRRTIPIDVSDSELEQSLEVAWANDRMKKKKRKKERDELRAQGLLGKKGKVDLKVKYSRGMEMAQVLKEVKGFLASTRQSLSLPPMGQRERKLVHELAHVFGLKSMSVGDGVSRFPTLIRTRRTVPFNEALIPKRISHSFGIFLPRKDKATRRGPSIISLARGGGFSKSAVSYRDGDVVGASAPELGEENRGRNILEKMGWSAGTALGALNNKGIIHPIPHVVKNSKAGLG